MEWGRMIGFLAADAGHSERSSELALFGQFVGTWRLDITLVDQAGSTVFDGPGEWTFGWILDGRAIQDVLVTPGADGTATPGLRGIGTSIRSFDQEADVWRVVWIGPASSTFIVLSGTQVEGEIRLEGGDPKGELVRWTFRDIQPDRFHWRGMTSSDGGRTWWEEQVMVATRRPS